MILSPVDEKLLENFDTAIDRQLEEQIVLDKEYQLTEFECLLSDTFSREDVADIILDIGDTCSKSLVVIANGFKDRVAMPLSCSYKDQKEVAIYAMSYACKSFVDQIARRANVKSDGHIRSGYDIAMSSLSKMIGAKGYNTKTILNISGSEVSEYFNKMIYK